MIIMSDDFFKRLIKKYSHGADHLKGIQSAKTKLDKVVEEWAGNCLLSTEISGSIAKGTATTLGSDFDLFISLNTSDTLEEVYNKLHRRLSSKGYNVRKQNVSLGITQDGLKVDMIPAKKHPGHTYDHSIWVSKMGTWKQTNVKQHVKYIKDSSRVDDARITKIWKELHKLDFPSFYAELSVIDALKYKPKNNLDLNFQHVLKFLSKDFLSARVVDPANSNNVISETLTKGEKQTIAQKAKEGYDAKDWNGVVW